MKTNTPSLILIFLFTGLAFLQPTRAVVPPPDGGYPGFNTAEGQNALFSRTTGVANTGVGWYSLFSNTDGSFNTALGAGTLLFNVGDQSTGNGTQNTAIGAAALLSNTTGRFNTAVGGGALSSNTEGFGNTATGINALKNNTTGILNTAIGNSALFSNSIGNNNTALGTGALPNTTGNNNVALGQGSGSAVTTANNVTCIGSGVPGGNVPNTTWIANVAGVTTQNGTTAPVIVSNDGQLGTVASSERFKKDIVTMEKASEAIMSLRPVTFHYKTDTKNTPQFGLIAEEVAKVNPALVLPDKDGKPYTVRYDQVNAMLLNEFLKEHKAFVEEQRKVQEQGATIARLEQQVKALTAGLQKVSAQLATASPSLADSN